MPDTCIETLLNKLSTNLAADVEILADDVYISRIHALDEDELPAYVIKLGADQSLGDLGPDNLAFIDWQQLVYIDLYASTKESDTKLTSIFLDMRNRVHRSLMADWTQGLSFVHTTIPAGAEDPILDDEGKYNTMVYRTNWIFRMRTNVNNLEAP